MMDKKNNKKIIKKIIKNIVEVEKEKKMHLVVEWLSDLKEIAEIVITIKNRMDKILIHKRTFKVFVCYSF